MTTSRWQQYSCIHSRYAFFTGDTTLEALTIKPHHHGSCIPKRPNLIISRGLCCREISGPEYKVSKTVVVPVQTPTENPCFNLDFIGCTTMCDYCDPRPRTCRRSSPVLLRHVCISRLELSGMLLYVWASCIVQEMTMSCWKATTVC